MSLKRQVNKAVTTIAQSKAKINASAQDLIRYSRVAVGLPEPQGEFVAHCIAERFAEQGEVQIKIKKDFAWPVAMVFSPVGQHWGLVRELFDATMFRRCPFLIPEYVKSKDYASRDAFLAASGREPGEEELAYFQRMAGFVRLWLAVKVLDADWNAVWGWFARFLNLPPERPAATLLHAALEAVSAAAHCRFKSQFRKLAAYIDEHYVPLLLELQAENRDILSSTIPLIQLWYKNFQGGRLPERPVIPDVEAELNRNL
jgi:hypothetical protein